MDDAWWDRLLALFAALFGGGERQGPRRPRRTREAAAPLAPLNGTPVLIGPPLLADLFILTGTGPIPLFAAGPTDPLLFFQRRGVPEEHDVEWIVRVDAATDEPLPWAVLKLRADLAVTMPDPQRAEGFWRDLYRGTGLAGLPKASTLLRGLAPRSFDLSAPDAGRGLNVPECSRPDTVFKTVTGRRWTHAEALRLVREGLRGVHLISWLEEAFPRRLEDGEVVHRYYLDRGHVYVVRHQGREPKRLFLAQPSDEALPLLASQAWRRRAA